MSKPSVTQPEKLVNLTLSDSDLNLNLLDTAKLPQGRVADDSIYLLYSKLQAVRERTINNSMWFINVYAVIAMGPFRRYSCIKSTGFSCKLKYKGANVDPGPFEELLTAFSTMSRALSGRRQSIVEYAGAPRLVEHLIQYNCIFDEILDADDTHGILLTIEREPGMSHSFDLAEGGTTDASTEATEA